MSVMSRRCVEAARNRRATPQQRVSVTRRWAFPTDMAGNSEPPPKTKLSSPAAAAELLARGPVADWRKALELICELSEARGQLVLPAADHGRVASFISFWEGLEFTPAWLTVVLRRLEALLGR